MLLICFLIVALAPYLVWADVFSAATPPACSCSSGFIDVDVDVEVPVDPSLRVLINSTALRRQRTTFNIFSRLCQPVGTSDTTGAIQLLLHGFTANNQYWDVQWSGFQNYSYIEYSCQRGVSSFAYDDICAGRTVKPVNSQECQLPTAAAVASSLARKLRDGSIGIKLTGKPTIFSKVFGIGHSIGSAVLNYAAIRDGTSSPFIGLILTGLAHIQLDSDAINSVLMAMSPAASINPSRWGNLDAGYITVQNIDKRASFFGPEGTFDPTIQQLDFLTEDIGPVWMATQALGGNTLTPTRFEGPVTSIGGGVDSIVGCPCNQTTFQAREKPFFPDAEYKAIIIPGQGHNLNLEFGAKDVFPIMLSLFKNGTK